MYLSIFAFASAILYYRCTLVFPLTSVQAKLMTQGKSMGRPIAYTGILDCLRKTVYGCEEFGIKPGGFRKLYAGWGPLLGKMVPAVGLEMAAIEVAMQFFKKFTG